MYSVQWSELGGRKAVVVVNGSYFISTESSVLLDDSARESAAVCEPEVKVSTRKSASGPCHQAVIRLLRHCSCEGEK